MANELRGQDILLDIRAKGDTEWLNLVCVRTYGLTTNTSELTTSNRCSGAAGVSKPNVTTYQVTFDGDIDVAPTSAQASIDQLVNWAKAQTNLEWRAYNAAQTYYRGGEGWLSTTEESGPQDAFATFSGTINGNGDFVTEAPVEP